MVLVLVRPPYPEFLEDRLFFAPNIETAAVAAPGHWFAPYAHLQQTAAQRGVRIHTWDQYPTKSADCILFQDLPSSRQEILALRGDVPQAALVLQLLESPVGRPHWFVENNHRLFDAILTYNPHLFGKPGYFPFRLPIGLPPEMTGVSIPFSERKLLVLINTNMKLGPTGAPFFRLWPPLTVVRAVREGGWCLPSRRETREHMKAELYSRRREVARAAEAARYDGLVDIFGRGWQRDTRGWHGEKVARPWRMVMPGRNYARARGPHAGCTKMDVIPRYRFCAAIENYSGDVGYISEKLFDAFYCGSVPVYWGESDITSLVPSSAFVDARKFRSAKALLAGLTAISENQWNRMRRAGEEFVDSRALDPFWPDAFASDVLRAVQAAVRNRSRREPLA